MARPAMEMTKCESRPDPTPWREEKVFIVPHDEGFRVVPPYKVVSKDQTVTFRVFGCERLNIDLPSIAFDLVKRTKDPTVVTVHVRADAPAGFYPYSAVCGDQEARGMSSPGMIVDP